MTDPTPTNPFVKANTRDVRHGVSVAALTVMAYAADHPDATVTEAWQEALRPLIEELSAVQRDTCASCGQEIIRRVLSPWLHTDEFESRKCASAADVDGRDYSGVPTATARPRRERR